MDPAPPTPLALPSRADIAATADRLSLLVRRTPVVEVDARDLGLPARRSPVVLKLELLQHAGSFKARGAHAQLLADDLPPAGVVAASGGNYGVAVAYAARRLNVPATVFVPDTTAPAKLDRLRGLGAVVEVVPGFYDDALAVSRTHAATSGRASCTPSTSPRCWRGRAPWPASWPSRPRSTGWSWPWAAAA